MIPLVLVTGFLGSGKTSLLRHLVERHRDRRLALLVNEFSPADVDGRTLARASDRVVCLAGGSIFCRCLVTSFIHHLRTIGERYHSPAAPLDGLLVEASGVADPRVVGVMLAETGLDRTYRLRTAVAVVDPGSFPALVHTLPNVAAQVEACHVAVLNKIDLFPPAQLAEVESAVRRINPSAQVIHAVRCRIDLDLFAEHPPRAVSGDYAACADPHYVVFHVPVSAALDRHRLREMITSVSDAFYRAKGFVPTSDGPVYLDFSASGLSIEPAPEARPPFELVFIVRAEAGDRVAAVLRPWGSIGG